MLKIGKEVYFYLKVKEILWKPQIKWLYTAMPPITLSMWIFVSLYWLHTMNCGLPSCKLSSSRSASAKPWLISSSSAWRRLYSTWSLSNSLLYSSLFCSLMMRGYSLRAWQHRIEVKSVTDYKISQILFLYIYI